MPVNSTSNNVFNQNNATHQDTDNTDRTLKIGIDIPENHLGVFTKTKKKTLEVIKELEKTLKKINDIKPEKKEVSVQAGSQATDARSPEIKPMPLTTLEEIENFKQINFSNLNVMNLMKEVAKEILIKSNTIQDDIQNVNEFCDQVNDQISQNYQASKKEQGKNAKTKQTVTSHPMVALQKDPEKQAMITQILNYYQEQIIFEEALAILQDKKVDLENLFVFAYQRLGINMEKTEENPSDQSDSDPSFSVVTDASLCSVSGYGDGYVEPDEENQINPSNPNTQFKKKNAGIVQSDRIGPSGGKLDQFQKA